MEDLNRSHDNNHHQKKDVDESDKSVSTPNDALVAPIIDDKLSQGRVSKNDQASFKVLTANEFALTKGQEATESISSQQADGSQEGGHKQKRRHDMDWKTIGKKIKASWLKHHLLWLLILGVIIGTTWPLPGKTLGDARLGNGLCLLTINSTEDGNSIPQEEQICVWSTISSLCVTIIFLVSGLQLKLDKMKRALMSPRSILIGYLLILILTTSFGYAVAAGPKLNPPEFSFGLALFAIMPTTLSACIVIVGFAKGDTALALLLSVTTNLLGVAILPLTLTWMVPVFHATSSSTEVTTTPVRVNELDLCLSLVFTALIPLVIGFALRRYVRQVNEFVEKFPITLKMISAFALASVPWMKISQSSSTFSQVDAAGYVVLIITGAALHLWFLVLCFIVSFVLLFYCSPAHKPKASSNEPQRDTLNDTEAEDKSMEEKLICLTLTGCQKTLPVALSVLELLPENAVGGNVGLVALAIVILQLMQTLMDSAIAIRWVDRNMTASVIRWFKLRPSPSPKSGNPVTEPHDGALADV